MPTLAQVIIAVISGGLFAALVSWYRARAQNNLDQAQAWKILLEQFQNRAADLQKDNDELELEIAERDGYIDKLVKILNAHGVTMPLFSPRRRRRRMAANEK